MSDKKPSTSTPRDTSSAAQAANRAQGRHGDDNSGGGGGSGRDEIEIEKAAADVLPAPPASDLVEVFECDNDVVARLVIDEILGPQGVYAALHDRRSHSLPAPAAMAGVVAVAVAEHDAARARRMLRTAQRDKVLLDDGSIVGETVA